MGRQMAEDLLMVTGVWLIAAGFVLLLWARLKLAKDKTLAIAFMAAGLAVFFWGYWQLSPSASTIFITETTSDDR